MSRSSKNRNSLSSTRSSVSSSLSTASTKVDVEVPGTRLTWKSLLMRTTEREVDPEERDITKEKGYEGFQVYNDLKYPAVDFVAVQGLNANPYYTWRAKSTGKIWVRDFLPDNIPEARIMTYSYNSAFARDANTASLETFARDFLEALALQRKLDPSRPLVLLGHSYGGLVVEKAITIASNYKDGDISKLFKSIIGVMFLGTPLRGAPSYILADALVTLNGFVGRKPEGKIIECLSRYNKELLQTLEDFKQKSNGFETFCFVETKKSYKSHTIVPLEYAVLDENNGRWATLECTHSGLNKYATRDDLQYLKLAGHIQRIVGIASKFEIENIEDFYKSTHIVSWPVEEEGNPFKRHNRFSRAEESRENKPEKLETCWAPNTCQWILGSDGRPETPVGQWLGAPRSKLLWITGGPGCGKTVLTSYLVHHLWKDSGPPVLYFFVKGTIRIANNVVDILIELLGQLFFHPAFDEHRSKFAREVYGRLKEHQASKDNPRRYFQFLAETFSKCAKELGDFYLLVDGLDECEGDQSTRDLAEYLVQLADLPGRAKVAIISRADKNLAAELDPVDKLQYAIEANDIESDMKTFARNGILKLLYKDKRFSGKGLCLDPEVNMKITKLVNELVNKGSGVFLWLKLALEKLKLDYHGKKFDWRYPDLPKDMPEMFRRIIEKSRERVGKERANEHRRILSLAITAQERLTKYEFAQAFDDIPLDSYIEDKIWEYCGPLVKLVGDQVVLIHYTAREFITSASTDEDLRIPEEVAHGDVAGICLKYLLRKTFNTPVTLKLEDFKEPEHLQPEYRLLRYASLYWYSHLSKSDTRPELRQLLQDFMQEGESHKQSSTWLDVHCKLLDREDFCSRIGYLFMINFLIKQWINKGSTVIKVPKHLASKKQLKSSTAATEIARFLHLLKPRSIGDGNDRRIQALDSDIFARFIVDKYEKMYEESRDRYGPTDKRTLERANEYAEVLGWPSGGNPAAEELLMTVLPMAEENLQLKDPITRDLIRNLAWCKKRLGKYSEAIHYIQKLLAEKYQGYDDSEDSDDKYLKDPEYQFLLDSLGWTYSQLGHWDEAQKYLKKAVDGTALALENSAAVSRLTLRTRLTLAEVYRKNNHSDLAQAQLEDLKKLIPEIKEELSPDDTVAAYNFLAAIAMEQKEYADAIAKYRELVRQREEVWGATHPLAAWAKLQLAKAYLKIPTRQKDAAELLIDLRPLAAAAFGVQHAHTWTVMNCLLQVWKVAHDDRVLIALGWAYLDVGIDKAYLAVKRLKKESRAVELVLEHVLLLFVVFLVFVVVLLVKRLLSSA